LPNRVSLRIAPARCGSGRRAAARATRR
jgi:hypothetical protein